MLNGKAALVTGGSRGIGAAIARRLARDGSDVAITYSRSADRARDVIDELKNIGVRALAIEAEAADPNAVRESVRRAAETFGRLDIAVSNAGIAPYGSFADVTVEEIDETMAIHARAAFVLCQEVVPYMTEGGRIISIGTSFVERMPQPGWSLYTMSKAALVGLTRGLARELAPRGILVNLVHPGSTDTELNPADGPDADDERRQTALGRYCDPEDVAAAVAYLASEGGRNITGTSMLVDAGSAV